MKKIFSLLVALTAVISLSAKTLYLTPNANWLKDNARFAIYTIDDQKWVDMAAVQGESNLFSGEVGDAIAKVIFCRMNPAKSENNWENKWNQSSDLDLVEGKDHYTVAEGAWDKGDGSWSKYEKYVSAWKEIKFTAATAAGKFNDSVFSVEGFELRCTDANSKQKTNESNASFADDKEKNDYNFRFQTGGKSSANNKLVLTIPADGALRIAVVTGADGDKERMVTVLQGEEKLLEEHAWDKDEKVDGYFPYLQVNVKKGAVELNYSAAVYFYAFGFLAGGSVPEPIDPSTEAKFYITGSKELVGEALAWNSAAIKVTEESYTFKSLAAGSYQMKVTVDGDWATAKGYSNLTEKAEGLSKDKDDNICFTLSEAGDVKVTYTAEVFKVEGNFFVAPVDPTPAKFYITGSKELVGEALAWNPSAIKVTEESYTFKSLAAGSYQMKVTVDGDWATAKGYSNLTEKAEGLSKDKDDNICFTLSEAGDVKVTYTAEVFKVEGNFKEATPEPQLKTGFYLVGSFNEWKPAAEYHFEGNPDNPVEFILQVTLSVGDKIKVVNVLDNNITAWYPNGEGNDYVVDAAHAGDKTIYFNPDYQEGWAEFGGYIWIAASSGDAITNTASDVKTVKVIRNGQLLIIKGDKMFNAQGAQMK